MRLIFLERYSFLNLLKKLKTFFIVKDEALVFSWDINEGWKVINIEHLIYARYYNVCFIFIISLNLIYPSLG